MISEVKLSAIVGGGYDKFWSDHSRYRVVKGGKGSKKSTTTALNLICRLMRYPESNLLVVRAVMNTHRDSTFAQLKWAQEKLGVAHLWSSSVAPLEMTYLPTGQKILFRGFDDVLKLASTTVQKGYLCFVWIEEAYVREEFRSKGLGRELFSYVEREYPFAARFRLEVEDDNLRAIKLYTNLGYKNLPYSQMIKDVL